MTPHQIIAELVALCELCDINESMEDDGYGWKKLYIAARAFLAEPEAQPVAWIDEADLHGALQDDLWCVVHAQECDPGADHNASIPLYLKDTP